MAWGAWHATIQALEKGRLILLDDGSTGGLQEAQNIPSNDPHTSIAQKGGTAPPLHCRNHLGGQRSTRHRVRREWALPQDLETGILHQ